MKTIILNNKCFLGYEESLKYNKEIENIKHNNIELVLMPSILTLSLFKDSKINIGAQNFYSYKNGSLTGEISLESLKEINVKYTLVAHPERLNLKIDSYEEAKDKLFRSLNSEFKTILCIGKDENEKMIKKELKYYLTGLEYNTFKNLIIAYEPTSKIEGEIIDINEIINVRNLVKSYINKTFEEEVTFIYGGSVNKDNIKEVLDITDGVIIGKASTNINEVKDILKQIS